MESPRQRRHLASVVEAIEHARASVFLVSNEVGGGVVPAFKRAGASIAIFCEHPASAVFDVARTVCRRAERQAVRLIESGESVNPQVLTYLNRLSDLLWLLGRLVEKHMGVDARLRDDKAPGARWSRAW